MELITHQQRIKMIRNGLDMKKHQGTSQEPDHRPVVKLFTPYMQCTWLLTFLYPNDYDVAFGLCDLGLGFPELGDVRISEIKSVSEIERDLHFEATKSILEYAKEARAAQRIMV